MNVTLRWKNNKNGSKTAYLDLYKKGQPRKKKYIGIKIEKNDTKRKEKKLQAEAIRTSFHKDVLDKKYDLVSEDKLELDFLVYFQRFLDGYKKAGYRKYRYAYEKFLTYLKHTNYLSKIEKATIVRKYSITNKALPFNQLSPQLCKDYKEYLFGPDSKLSGETPYDYFVRFRSVINKAFDERYLIENPVAAIKLEKPKSQLSKQILTKEELQVLANTRCGNTEVKRAFLFACFTGLGEKEIRYLTWGEVANGRLNTKRAKNSEVIASKLPETAKRLLGEKGPAKQRIFTLPSDVAVSKNLKNWVKKAAIDKHITFYCGRHTFAILNLKNGANLKTISKLLGHSTTVHTNKYLNYLDEAKDDAMDNLPELDF